MKNGQAIGLLVALLSLTGGALRPSAAVAATGEHRRPGNELARPDWVEAERLAHELLERLASVTTESEVSWHVTEILLDPRLHELVQAAVEHGALEHLDRGAPDERVVAPELAYLVELFHVSSKTSRALLDEQQDRATVEVLRAMPSFRELLYDSDVPAWMRLGWFDGLSAHFCFAVLLSQPIADEPRRILAAEATRGFESMIRANVALLERQQLAVPEGVAELGLEKLDPDALEAEQAERDADLDEWFAES